MRAIWVVNERKANWTGGYEKKNRNQLMMDWAIQNIQNITYKKAGYAKYIQLYLLDKDPNDDLQLATKFKREKNILYNRIGSSASGLWHLLWSCVEPESAYHSFVCLSTFSSMCLSAINSLSQLLLSLTTPFKSSEANETTFSLFSEPSEEL